MLILFRSLDGSVIGKQPWIKFERFHRFQRDVIPEADCLRIEHYIPYGNNHRWYGHCKWVEDECEAMGAAESTLSVSKTAIKPEKPLVCVSTIAFLLVSQLPETRIVMRARFEGITSLSVWTSLSRTVALFSVEV